jgi:hypothetical protein
MNGVEKKKQTALHLYRGNLQSEIRPIVLEYKKRKKKKKVMEDEPKEKYSRGLEDIQNFEGNLLRLTKRSANALSKGLDSYRRERKISTKAKRDGAIEDFVDNSAKAASTYMKEVSEIPMDIAESLNIKPVRKQMRKNLRRASKMIGLFRI